MILRMFATISESTQYDKIVYGGTSPSILRQFHAFVSASVVNKNQVKPVLNVSGTSPTHIHSQPFSVFNSTVCYWSKVPKWNGAASAVEISAELCVCVPCTYIFLLTSDFF